MNENGRYELYTEVIKNEDTDVIFDNAMIKRCNKARFDTFKEALAIMTKAININSENYDDARNLNAVRARIFDKDNCNAMDVCIAYGTVAFGRMASFREFTIVSPEGKCVDRIRYSSKDAEIERIVKEWNEIDSKA